MKRRIAITLLLVLDIVIAGFIIINIMNGINASKAEAEPVGEKNQVLAYNTTYTMSMDDLLKDRMVSVNSSQHTYYSKFKSLNDGDTLIIKDKIWNMSYNNQYNATLVLFSSNKSEGLVFSGDITNDFKDGEKVKVTLHIIEDKFDYNYGGQTWKIDMEYYKEGWDMQNHTGKPLPSWIITYARASTVIMNVTQYLSDGNYSINKTKHEFFNDYRSLKPGDILIIKGWIAQPPKYRRDERLKVNVTTLTISDSGKKAWPIVIYANGNVEGKYREGDLVEIRLHIKYYDIHQRWNNETWHIYGELPEESILNGKYTGGEIIVPPSQISFIIYVDDDFNPSTPRWNITHFNKIQDAINAANDEDTIFVYNGTYYENIIINKSIILIGEDRNATIIDGGNRDAVNIAADGVSIRGFTVTTFCNPYKVYEGDFAEIYYIGYFENGSVFDSSFVGENISWNTSFDDKNYTIVPLKIYMGNDIPTKYPKGWGYSDIGTIKRWKVPEIKGLYNALLGMKEGEEKIIKLNASEAFGKAVVPGIKFNTTVLFGFESQFEIVEIDTQNDTVDLKWLPKIGQRFTMPQYWYSMPISQPYWLWKNATEVISFNETNVTLRITPNKLHNITVFPWWENASSVGYNESKIWITTTPPLGNFTIYWGNYEIPGKVLNITKDKIIVWMKYGKNETTQEMNRTQYFDRVINLPRIFKKFPQLYVEDGIKKLGYSFHELAGKNAIFRVKLLGVYRVNEELGTGINITGSNVAIQNCKIYSFEMGIKLMENSNNSIYNCIINNNYGGIEFENSYNNTISNCNLYENNWDGIVLRYSYNNTMSNCNIYDNPEGIWLIDSYNNTISNCDISNNGMGILLDSSSNNNTISNCNFLNDGIIIDGDELSHFIHNIYNNTVNGEPLLYYKNENNIVIDGIEAGEIILANCSNFEIRNENIRNIEVGMEIAYGNNGSIYNCNISSDRRSILSLYSRNITLYRCNISHNGNGILIHSNKIITMSMDELLTERVVNTNSTQHTYYMNFKSLNDGDTLIIKDKIWNMSYNNQYNATLVLFSSNKSEGLVFSGDITNDFKDGEKVKVTLHIIEDKFDYNYGGQTWKIDMEYYKEGWDMQNHTGKPLPESVMSLCNNCRKNGNYEYGSISNNTIAAEIILINCSNFEIGKISISNAVTGIKVASSNNIFISNSNIISNNDYGVYAYHSSNVSIRYNNIYNNSKYGIYYESWGENYNISASYNYWGSPSGPYHPILNPNGAGDNVSNGVIFKPWLTAPVKGAKEEKLQQGENEINAIDEADAIVKINSTGNETAKIISYESSPVKEPKSIKAVGKYVEIDVKNESVVQWPLFIKIYYTQEDLEKAGVTEDKLLGIYFYNETSKEWQLYNDTGVNTTDVVIDGKEYDGYACAYAWHLTNLTISADNMPPKISNIKADPQTQEMNGFVNITCNVTDNVNVSSVCVNITYPDGSYHNFSMIRYGDIYYFNQTYSIEGNYTYFIIAIDKSGNKNISLQKHFSVFTPHKYTLATSVSPSNAGYITLNPSSGTYEDGTVVTVTAHAYSGYTFDYWEGDASGSSATITITMNRGKSIIAYFVKVTPSPPSPPPNQPPTITITSPSNGSTVNGTITIHGDASDDKSVVKVEIRIDGGEWIQAEGTTTWSYSIDTTLLNNGKHKIEARSYDSSLYSDVASISINVFNNHKPIIVITSPLDNSAVKGSIVIKGKASDEDGNDTLQKVEIRIDGKEWHIANGITLWQYSINTKELKNGMHKVDARSYDGHEYSNIASITIEVKNKKKTPGFEIIAIILAIAIIVAIKKRRKPLPPIL